MSSTTFLAVCCLAWCLSHSASALEPNIVLCMGDDHGWEETGYNGHPHVKTPVLDEMAASGLRLNHFYAGHPTCSPTRGSVLTGRHPNRYGTFTPNWSIRPEEQTVAHLLGKIGYECGHFGKWHVGPVKASSPTCPGAMGFDQWVSHDNFFELNPQLSRNGGPPERFEGESSAVVVQETIQFIDRALEKKKPFLVVLWFGSPHEPYSGLPDDLALYDDLPQSYADRSVKLTSNETGSPTSRPLRDVLRERYAEITAMDRAIGTLRRALDEKGLRKNTLLWYCGDNGTPSSGQLSTPFRGQKGQMYEGGIRVPGIVEWPQRIAAPLATDVSAVTSDMLPTICAVIGAKLPQRPIDGINLLPLIDGKMKGRPSPICFWGFDTRGEGRPGAKPWIDEKLQQGTTPLVKLMDGRLTRNFRNYHHPTIEEDDYRGERAIIDGDYKLVIGGAPEKETRELFNLKADPAEKSNLVQRETERAADLEQRLHRWQQSVLNSLTGADYEASGR